MSAFIWRVAVGGYCWESTDGSRPELDQPPTDEDEEGNFHNYCLTPVEDRYREYEPAKESSLFLTFATTTPTCRGIREFANRYGSLGDDLEKPGVDFEALAETAANIGDDLEEPGEMQPSVDDETEEQAEKTEERKEKFLEECVRDLRASDRLSVWLDAIKEMRVHVIIWHRIKIGKADKKDKRRFLIGLSDRLHLNEERISVGLVEDGKRPSGYALQIVPSSLLGFLWVQFAEAVSANSDHRECATCGDWYEVSLNKYRKSRQYCSPECRHLAYRRRREDARKLAEAGKTPHEIAKRLKSKMATVKGWLKRGKE